MTHADSFSTPGELSQLGLLDRSTETWRERRCRTREFPPDSVGAGVGFYVGEKPFDLDPDREWTAAVIMGEVNVDAIDVPQLPQASLSVPWNGGLAVDGCQLTGNGVEALGCLMAPPQMLEQSVPVSRMLGPRILDQLVILPRYVGTGRITRGPENIDRLRRSLAGL